MNPFPEIHDFLGCLTPKAWVEQALLHQDVLLIDHANCEKKAAACALQLIHCYPHHHDLLQKMARLAREELLHFQKVAKLLKTRRIAYQPLRPGRYAQKLRAQVRTSEPRRLMDFLIIGAFIEARSCERFHAIAPHLDPELSKFYQNLYDAEKRHYQDYLKFALETGPEEEVLARIQTIRELETALINTKDELFRFHSGIV